ncbi:MAG: hypothetical protein ABI270_11360 [Nitrosospira sp.]
MKSQAAGDNTDVLLLGGWRCLRELQAAGGKNRFVTIGRGRIHRTGKQYSILQAFKAGQRNATAATAYYAVHFPRIFSPKVPRRSSGTP